MMVDVIVVAVAFLHLLPYFRAFGQATCPHTQKPALRVMLVTKGNSRALQHQSNASFAQEVRVLGHLISFFFFFGGGGFIAVVVVCVFCSARFHKHVTNYTRRAVCMYVCSCRLFLH